MMEFPKFVPTLQEIENTGQREWSKKLKRHTGPEKGPHPDDPPGSSLVKHGIFLSLNRHYELERSAERAIEKMEWIARALEAGGMDYLQADCLKAVVSMEEVRCQLVEWYEFHKSCAP